MKVPIHHNYISNLNINQLLVYSSLVSLDGKAEFEKIRNYVEYLASFSDSKAVAEVKRLRGDSAEHKASNEEFDQQISTKEFIPKDILDAIGREENTNLSSNNIEKKRKKGISGRMIARAIED